MAFAPKPPHGGRPSAPESISGLEPHRRKRTERAPRSRQTREELDGVVRAEPWNNTLWRAIQLHDVEEVVAVARAQPGLLLQVNKFFDSDRRGCVPLEAAVRHRCPLAVVLALAEAMPPQFLDDTKSNASKPEDLSQKRTLRELVAWYGQRALDGMPSPGTPRAAWGREPTQPTVDAPRVARGIGLRGDEARQAWWEREQAHGALQRQHEADTKHWLMTEAKLQTKNRDRLTPREVRMVTALCSAIHAQDGRKVAKLARLAPVSKHEQRGEGSGPGGSMYSPIVSALRRRAPFNVIQPLVRRHPAALLERDPLADKLPLEIALEMGQSLGVIYCLAGACPAGFLDGTRTTVSKAVTSIVREPTGDGGFEEVEVEELVTTVCTLRQRLLEYSVDHLEGVSAAELRQLTLWRDVHSFAKPDGPPEEVKRAAQRHEARKQSKLTRGAQTGRSLGAKTRSSRVAFRRQGEQAAESGEELEEEEEEGEAARAKERVGARAFVTSVFLHGYSSGLERSVHEQPQQSTEGRD
jgi:hypothetical protein